MCRQRLFQWLESSVIGALPQFNVSRGILESLDDGHHHAQVVLVPADAGLALGLVFDDPGGEWLSVFLPGAPQWTSGSVVFARRTDVQVLSISFHEATRILKHLGARAGTVLDRL